MLDGGLVTNECTEKRWNVRSKDGTSDGVITKWVYQNFRSVSGGAGNAAHCLVGRQDTPILCFLEDRKAAEIGIRKQNTIVTFGQVAPLGRKDCSHPGAGHGMPESHDVDMRNTRTDVGMHALQIVEDCLFPVIPIFVQQELAIYFWRSICQGPIEGPDGPFDVGAQGLMRGIDVSESR